MGDGEMAEGSVWEAANMAVFTTNSTTCAPSWTSTRSARAGDAVRHEMDEIAARWGGLRLARHHGRRPRHPALLEAYAEAEPRTGRPTVILAVRSRAKGSRGSKALTAGTARPLKKGEELDRAMPS
jgi:transketolase N-terminal domain/subunit